VQVTKYFRAAKAYRSDPRAGASHHITSGHQSVNNYRYHKLTVHSTYSCCWGAATSLLFTLQKLYKQQKRTVATMLRFSIPIQYIQAAQFIPNNVYKSQNLRELSNRLTFSDMDSVPNAENYIKPVFMGNKRTSCTNNYGTLIYEFNQANC
jgi:hypothetical protein